jgi:hypothetical protein
VIAGSVSTTGGLTANNVSAATVAATGAVSGASVTASGYVKAGGTVFADGDVRAEGGVWVGIMAAPATTSAGALSGATFNSGCSSTNRGELRLLERAVSGGDTYDWFCACIKIAANDFQWTCMRP